MEDCNYLSSLLREPTTTKKRKKVISFSFSIIRNIKICNFFFYLLQSFIQWQWKRKLRFRAYRRWQPQREPLFSLKRIWWRNSMQNWSDWWWRLWSLSSTNRDMKNISLSVLLAQNLQGIITRWQPTKMRRYCRMIARRALTEDLLLDSHLLTTVPLK